MEKRAQSGVIMVGGRGPEPTRPPTPIVMPPIVIVNDDEDGGPEYVEGTTGKRVVHKPCCCRTIDARFPLEMDDETAHVYREAKVCSMSYTTISSWCCMMVFGTLASGGIVAMGFMNKKMLNYQIVGIVLCVISGVALPLFFVFWVMLKKQECGIRKNYRAMKNRQLAYDLEAAASLGYDSKGNKILTSKASPGSLSTSKDTAKLM